MPIVFFRGGALLIMAAAFSVFSALAGEAMDAERIARALESGRRSASLQTDLPLWRSIPQRDGGSTGHDAPVVSADMAQVMLWLSLTILLIVVLFMFRDSLPSGAKRPGAAPPTRTEAEAIHSRMVSSQDEADRVADAGRYIEAIHTLLLQALAEMRRRLHSPMAQSLTSREILETVPLDQPYREPLAALISQVEISYFGPFDPGQGEYAACREWYDRIRAALTRLEAAA